MTQGALLMHKGFLTRRPQNPSVRCSSGLHVDLMWRSRSPADSCSLPMDEGSCERYTLRWYFNSQVGACRPFIYSGCDGNSNRFLHQEECEALSAGMFSGHHIHFF
uniref:BPTI/Kunitz inhibitor domain-containing protein n=1 Tax=Oryzias melastigma TaxID=30732 RepID=A0A3B3DEE1_ORYME